MYNTDNEPYFPCLQAMTVFAGGSTKFDAELYPSFSRLCRDPSVPVRKTMASGFHEVGTVIIITYIFLTPNCSSLFLLPEFTVSIE